MKIKTTTTRKRVKKVRVERIIELIGQSNGLKSEIVRTVKGGNIAFVSFQKIGKEY